MSSREPIAQFILKENKETGRKTLGMKFFDPDGSYWFGTWVYRGDNFIEDMRNLLEKMLDNLPITWEPPNAKEDRPIKAPPPGSKTPKEVLEGHEGFGEVDIHDSESAG